MSDAEDRDVGDTSLTIRFKHGIHTIFLFVGAFDTTAQVSTKLLRALRARYPDGLVSRKDEPDEKTPVPEVPATGNQEHAARLVEFARLVNPSDPSQGWIRVNARPSEVLSRQPGAGDGEMLAFRFTGDGEEEWPVDWPEIEDGDDFYGNGTGDGDDDTG